MVCTANQCRSPMAEHLLRQRLGPDSQWKVLSAGTSAIDGMRASRSAIEAMAGLGVDITSHRSRSLTKELVDSAEMIITMTRSQKDEIVDRFPRAIEKVFTLKSIAGDKSGSDVEDPVGMSETDYLRTRDEIDGMLADLVLFLSEQE